MNSVPSGESIGDGVTQLPAVVPEDWVLIGQHWFLEILLRIGEACCNDLTAANVLPQGISRLAIGAVIKGLVRAGLIYKTGRYVRTTSTRAHAREIPVWGLKSAQLALDWIESHPVSDQPSKPLRQRILFGEREDQL